MLPFVLLLAARAVTADENTPDTAWAPAHGLRAAVVVSGLSAPDWAGAPPGDPRLFVIEQNGTIRIVKAGRLLPTPFLDVRSLVSTGGERGLLGLAFHTKYASNGTFFVNYT